MIQAEAVIPPDVSRHRAEIWPSTIKALEMHTKGTRTSLIPMYISETGTSREKAAWGYVIGSVLPRGIGRATFRTP